MSQHPAYGNLPGLATARQTCSHRKTPPRDQHPMAVFTQPGVHAGIPVDVRLLFVFVVCFVRSYRFV